MLNAVAADNEQTRSITRSRMFLRNQFRGQLVIVRDGQSLVNPRR